MCVIISSSLAAQVQDKQQTNAISGYATKQVAADLRDLHTLYGQKIAPFAAGGRYAQPLAQGNNASIAEALKFYQDFEPKVTFSSSLFLYFCWNPSTAIAWLFYSNRIISYSHPISLHYFD